MHLLTGHTLHIIVEEDVESMSAGHKFESRCTPTAWLCFLLALLFLYNPYLVLTPSSASLNVRHTASYRATVGSSELQHFSPTDGRKTFTAHVAILFDWLERPLNSSAEQSIEANTPDVHGCKIVCSDLWFRPPPVV